MSVPIVIDEWLFHDLAGENGDEKQEETWLFLFRLLKICDRVVILEGSPFEIKMKRFIKGSGKRHELREISKLLNNIARNASKTELIAKDDIDPLPAHLVKLVPTGDQYLFQAHLKLKGSFILTTDNSWPTKLMKNQSLNIKMRDQFLEKYR